MTLIGLSDSANENDNRRRERGHVHELGLGTTRLLERRGPRVLVLRRVARLQHELRQRQRLSLQPSSTSAPPSVSPAVAHARRRARHLLRQGMTTYEGHTVNCILADGQLYDIIPISNGISTWARTTTTPARTTPISVPRSLEHATAVGTSTATATSISLASTAPTAAAARARRTR